MGKGKQILLVGLGAFGKNHYAAWQRLGMLDRLYISDLAEESRKFLEEARFDLSRFSPDWRSFIERVDIVDVVTGTESHFPLCKKALEAGKDLFCEKPLTPTSAESQLLAEMAERSGAIVQVGYYYRYHPAIGRIQEILRSGALGRLRYVKAEFLGFKRPRRDIGVMHTDGIHFIDLLTWLQGSAPASVFGITRDHLNRNLEDLAIGLFTYPDGVVANIEAGYIQPGRWRDKVVPGAMTTKTITWMGSKAALIADFESDELEIIHAEHEKGGENWRVSIRGSERPYIPNTTPVEMICNELSDFLVCVEERRKPEANAGVSGALLGKIMEAFYKSASEGRSISLS